MSSQVKRIDKKQRRKQMRPEEEISLRLWHIALIVRFLIGHSSQWKIQNDKKKEEKLSKRRRRHT